MVTVLGSIYNKSRSDCTVNFLFCTQKFPGFLGAKFCFVRDIFQLKLILKQKPWKCSMS